ncbi:glucan endo-1,3-beta-glucosidase-like [Malania oleifera]|uniref:glucan endo-1,3-beta-glucosidase-like n=1 Tax=Malania oleifera TaxID=397392 RepID=UPI0025AE1077|nr:glucan endo-1,3-beta-glucosidase-like [Malania oleifera]
MATTNAPQPSVRHLILLISAVFLPTALSIGVNYGTLGNDLPPPAQVASFLKTQTTIDRIKLFDTNPDILRAFAGSGISVAVTAANGDIPALAKLSIAQSWVANNISPFHPKTRISHVLVGNEIMATADKNLISHLVPAMRTLHAALKLAGITDISVTTPHSMGILAVSEPPSLGRFRRGYDKAVFGPMLQFLKDTKSPFMVNPYPYFGYSPKMGNYALFKRNPGVHDRFTGITYTNMFDGMMDAVYSAMKALGYGDVEIAVGETGWPSVAEPNQPGVSPQFAATYNGRLVWHVTSGKGTPLMRGRKFETYLFALFNENQKPGPTAERNFGLFRPDFSPVYDIGIMRGSQGGGHKFSPTPATPASGKKWCVAKPEATDPQLQSNINYVCSLENVDCKPVQAGGACFNPNSVRAHASYLMNSYYQTSGRHDYNCDFSHTAVLTTIDPSTQGCKYVA